MPWWSRIANVFRSDRVNREIDEELESHIQEAIENGRDPAEVRSAFGSMLKHREESRDARMIAWLESLRADAVYGWRQMKKHKVTSAAAILSLALAIGACTSAFRLIDALLFRPLPIVHADRMHVVAFENTGPMGRMTYDSCSYPMFQGMRSAVRGDAELVAVSYADRMDLTYGSDEEMEKENVQYVSGWMFEAFGLQPALGRLFTEADDQAPGAHPYAVLSYDYWTRRFGKDPGIVGRTFRIGTGVYEIVGVADRPFTGTETGTVTGIFLPMAMKNPDTLASPNHFWLRTFVLLKPGVSEEAVQDKLRAAFRSIQEERAQGFVGLPKPVFDAFGTEKMFLDSAAAGRSNLQRDYKRALAVIGALVALVLLIVCANVANLMTAQAAARAREMALRVSIGAGRARLIQMALVESAMRAGLAAVVGVLFAWWSAPFVVSMINPHDNPVRLELPADWRVLLFGVALTLVATLLAGIAPALQASGIKVMSALKGGENPHSRRRLMHGLIAAQVAFCFVVLFLTGLFVATLQRLSRQPTGFSAERILNLETVTRQPQPQVFWDQVAEHLREVPGIERVAMTVWPLMSGESWVNDISVHGGPPSEVMSDFLSVSPGWFDEMKIPFLDGRDFRPAETFPPAAIVNQTFANQYFAGENPVGKAFQTVDSAGHRVDFEIVGFVRDARSRDNLRFPVRPTAYVPFHTIDANGALQQRNRGTFVARTFTANPVALAPVLRQEVSRARPEFRVSNIRTQLEINQARTVRERLLTTLAVFFAAVALLLAGVGLYGVLHYSVLQRQREIGIRIAVGARAGVVARLVTADIFSMVIVGAAAGLTLGMASVRYIESLFYQVKASDPAMLAIPTLTMLAVALLAALPAVVHAVRIDPASLLRAE
ncbi:MAG TPA: ABC transporter permease [Candidatus Acidoferrum sp.]|nr:ABC transporter permease [Candidatus Acidoferrum sp.]